MLETIVGFVALGISIFAVAISIVFYFKSDNLYKEMLKLISEIRVFSERTYTDTFGMVKEAWHHTWEKIPKESIEKESDEKIKQIKEDISNEMKQEIDKIKKLDLESVKRDQFEKTIGILEQRLSRWFDETSRRVAEVERERERKIIEQPKEVANGHKIEKFILEWLSMISGNREHAGFLVSMVADKLKVNKNVVADTISLMRDKGLINYAGTLDIPTVVSLKK